MTPRRIRTEGGTSTGIYIYNYICDEEWCNLRLRAHAQIVNHKFKTYTRMRAYRFVSIFILILFLQGHVIKYKSPAFYSYAIYDIISSSVASNIL